MKVSFNPSFKAHFNDCERFLCDAEKQAFETGRMKDFNRATWNIGRCFPDGEISKFSLPEKDVFCLTPNSDVNIKISNGENTTRELDSLVKLSEILQKLS